jgi:hypothetical protein
MCAGDVVSGRLWAPASLDEHSVEIAKGYASSPRRKRETAATCRAATTRQAGHATTTAETMPPINIKQSLAERSRRCSSTGDP